MDKLQNYRDYKRVLCKALVYGITNVRRRTSVVILSIILCLDIYQQNVQNESSNQIIQSPRAYKSRITLNRVAVLGLFNILLMKFLAKLAKHTVVHGRQKTNNVQSVRSTFALSKQKSQHGMHCIRILTVVKDVIHLRKMYWLVQSFKIFAISAINAYLIDWI